MTCSNATSEPAEPDVLVLISIVPSKLTKLLIDFLTFKQYLKGNDFFQIKLIFISLNLVI